MDDREMGWVAGLLEGEAYFQLAVYARKRVRGDRLSTWNEVSIMIRVSTTDVDVAERLREVTGVGKIIHRRIQGISKKPQVEWRLARRDDLRALLPQVYPLMSARRQERIAAMLDYLGIEVPTPDGFPRRGVRP